MNTSLKVVDGPCWSDCLAARLVQFPDRSEQVQLWRDGRWLPGGCLMDLLEKPWIRRAELRMHGIRTPLAPEHPDAGKPE